MPYKDPEKRKAAQRKCREKAAAKQGRALFPKGGNQPTIPRCENCPETGRPCRDCYNAHRRTYRIKTEGYIRKYVPKQRSTAKVKPKRPKPFKHRVDVVVQPVAKFLNDELFSCPGCMRKLRGQWRYCDRCEAKNNAATEST